MKIQVINKDGNVLIDEILCDNIKFLPRISEILALKSGAWLVSGVAHMWDNNVIKLICKKAS